MSETKRFMRWLLLLVMVVSVGSWNGVNAQSDQHPHYRAVWVDTWNPGILDEESTRLTVARLRQHGFNSLFVEVSKTMDAYYRSSLLPPGNNLNPAGFDSLKSVLKYAKPHTRATHPLEVHAWVVVLRAWKDKPFPPNTLKPPHVLNAHPEWLSRDVKGNRFGDGNYFLDPGVPAVQDFLCAIMRELVAQYRVDGLHLDYIRYPGKDWGYNPVALARFQKETGFKGTPKPTDPVWSQWRRDQITALVRRISAEVKELRPGIKVSVAGIAWGDVPDGKFEATRAYQDALQDWLAWDQAGYVDVSIPMIYKRNSDSLQTRDFRDWNLLARKNIRRGHLVVGLGAWLNPWSATRQQITRTLKTEAEGYCLFSFNQLDNTKRDSAHILRDISTKTPEIPPADWLERPQRGIVAGSHPGKVSRYPVLLLDPSERVMGQTTTDANGHFAFFDIPPGTVKVRLGKASTYSKPLTVQRGKVARAQFVVKD